MPPFLPRAEGVWGPAPRRVCAARSLPARHTRPLVLWSTAPLPAKPNTNASLTAAPATRGLRAAAAASEALLAESPHYCLETRDSDASSILLSPMGRGARHEVKEPSSSREARGALLFRDRPPQRVCGQPFVRNRCSGTGLGSGDLRMNKAGNEDPLRNSPSKWEAETYTRPCGVPEVGEGTTEDRKPAAVVVFELGSEG